MTPNLFLFSIKVLSKTVPKRIVKKSWESLFDCLAIQARSFVSLYILASKLKATINQTNGFRQNKIFRWNIENAFFYQITILIWKHSFTWVNQILKNEKRNKFGVIWLPKVGGPPPASAKNGRLPAKIGPEQLLSSWGAKW